MDRTDCLDGEDLMESLVRKENPDLKDYLDLMADQESGESRESQEGWERRET